MAKNKAAVALGKIKTPKKAEAARKNGALGGRPKGSKNKPKTNPVKLNSK